MRTKDAIALSLMLMLGLALESKTLGQPGYKVFSDSIVPLPPSAKTATPSYALTEGQSQHRLLLHFALENSGEKELSNRVARGEIVSPKELTTIYGGNRTNFDRLETWLRRQEFEIVSTSPDFTSIYARATIAQIQKSLNVRIAQIEFQGSIVSAATTPPRLPFDVGAHVVAIGGLQEFVRAHKNSIPRSKYMRHFSPHASVPVPRPASVNVPAYRVQDILSAYGATNLGVTGQGQTIAILIDTSPASSDVVAFWQNNGLPVNQRVTIIKVLGSNTTLPATEGEETLDTEWASGIAPGAKIKVYASGSLGFTYLDLALDKILADVLTDTSERHLSISLGLGETYISPAEIKVEHSKFERLAALGVNTFVSSGDAGSNPDETGHKRGSVEQVEYEASDPDVIAVGGTTLQFRSGSVQSETGWSDSGGGISAMFDKPTWQPIIASLPSGGKRIVPDVSAVADPIPGGYVIFNGAVCPMGGTSWSAPIWAGFSALIAEARSKAHKPPLPFLGPLLYSSSASGFRDITQGSNGGYQARKGLDAVTGLGVPNMQALISTLSTP